MLRKRRGRKDGVRKTSGRTGDEQERRRRRGREQEETKRNKRGGIKTDDKHKKLSKATC